MSASTPTLTPDTPHPVSGVGAVAEGALRNLQDQLGAEILDTTIRTGHVGTVPTASASALVRAARDDYRKWLGHVSAAAACSHPVRLAGRIHHIDGATGEILSSRDTADMPDGVIYKACGNRRKAVCPACAETYRADAYQLVLAGLKGGKGIPESVTDHPAVFATLTAPSFGPVHTNRTGKHGQPIPCRARRTEQVCEHGVDLRCPSIHGEGDQVVGTPLCLDCYDHQAQVVFNLFSGELFRRTRIALNRIMTRHAKRHGTPVRVSYGKAAEMQKRGAIHFHVLARLDGLDPADKDRILPPPAWASVFVLANALREAVERTAYTTPAHEQWPEGWRLEWGAQLDIRPVRVHGDETINDDTVLAHATATGTRRRTLSHSAVSGYLAKYATKSTEDTGHVSQRLTTETIGIYADDTTHVGRLIGAAWRLGTDKATEYWRLRRWAHTLGYGGHFFTKSHRYTTTFARLRAARVEWRRHHHNGDPAGEDTRIVVTELTYQGRGWNTTGDALLANTAAALAREHRRVARDEMQEIQCRLEEVI